MIETGKKKPVINSLKPAKYKKTSLEANSIVFMLFWSNINFFFELLFNVYF